VKEGSTGLKAPVGDAAELARQVLRVLADQDLRARLIAGGTNAVASFTFEQTAAKTLAIYREVLEH
jgi:glycosyltransferase involved in cell wall biosynthesis